jgi:hypothetical protein
MSPVRDLPARPSLDSLRKQAKKLARDAAADSGEALARVHAQLPRATLPLSTRDAQLVIAREYGFAGWSDLTAEVEKRLGNSLDWAGSQAKVAIHDRDDARLQTLLADYPALISWRDEHGQTLMASTGPYALDCSDPQREHLYTRPIAAERLIDAGATVERDKWEYMIGTGSAGMLHLFARKRVLPRTLPVLAALGDEEAVRARLEKTGPLDDTDGLDDRVVVGRALVNACRFKHTAIATLLLERAIALDPELGRRIDRWRGRQAFLDYLIENPGTHWSGTSSEGREKTLWEAFVIRQLTSALNDDDLPAFRRWLDEEPWVLEAAFVPEQNGLVQRASYMKKREHFIMALLDRDPALLRTEPPPRSQAIVHALSYGNAHLIPLLTRIWPLPDDLPHAAGIGNAAAVARWFDASGEPVLGSLAHQYPGSDPNFPAGDLGWGPVTTQQVLDIALAWAVLNRHFEIASFLLERGADINTNWSTHEPASILHEAAINGNEDAVRFLVDHGADLAKEDFRYESNAEGWARYGSGDERMAELLAAAAASRKSATR